MRLVRLVGPGLFLAGLASLVLGFLNGQATLSLFVIFPVVTATGAWAVLGIVLLVAGVFLFFFTWSAPLEMPPAATPGPPSSAPSAGSGARRWGGVVFLGPIPVVFGSDQKVTQWMLLMGVALFVAVLVLTVIVLWGI